MYDFETCVIVFMYMCLCYEVDVVSGASYVNTKKWVFERREHKTVKSCLQNSVPRITIVESVTVLICFPFNPVSSIPCSILVTQSCTLYGFLSVGTPSRSPQYDRASYQLTDK